MTKLVLRFHAICTDAKAVNALRAEVRSLSSLPAPSRPRPILTILPFDILLLQAMLIMASIVRVGQSKFVAVPIDEDSQERILNCVQTLAQLEDSKPAQEIFLEDTKAAYTKMVTTAERKVAEKKAKESKSVAIQADDLISFRQFTKKVTGGDADEVSRGEREGRQRGRD